MRDAIQRFLKAETVRFVGVGLINTAIDFTVLNLLISLFGWPTLISNILSITVAMCFSFIANKTFVFRSKSHNEVRQAVLFVAGTLASLYIIQSVTIYFLTEMWTWPLDVGVSLINWLGLSNTFSHDFVYTNGAKLCATVLSMIWNFVFYKRIVFKDSKDGAKRT